MSTAVLEGLSINPAAPADVLIRLVDRHGENLRQEFASRPLPAALVDHMLRHPTRQVRRALAANLTVDLRIRVGLIDDPDAVVIAGLRHDRRRPLPPDAADAFLEGFDRMAALGHFTKREAREEQSIAMAADRRLLTPAARHPNPNVRAVAVFFEEELNPADQAALRADSAAAVREAHADIAEADARTTELAELIPVPSFSRWLQLGRRLTPAVLASVLAADDTQDLTVLAANPHMPADVVASFIVHHAERVRSAVAHRTDLTAEQLDRLTRDPHPLVRNAISVHPALTERQRAAIGVDLRYVPGEGDFGNCHHSESWGVDPAWTYDEATRWARSSNVLLRRRAARSPELTPSLVPELADDDDLGVRVLLALHSTDAPPSLLLRSYLEYEGCDRETLLRKRGFPGEGLAAYWCDPDPALRVLAALDRYAESRVVTALLRDRDPDVRRAIAVSPLLPPRQIVALLDDVELARAAASNPALPVEAMWRLLR